MNPFSESPKSVVIPLIYSEGSWKPFYGGDMPEFRDGSYADLTVSALAFSKPDEIGRFQLERTVEILPAGTRLWAKMSSYHYVGPLKRGLPTGFRSDLKHGLETAYLVGFDLLEPLCLQFHGTKEAELNSSRCGLDGVEGDEPILSVNHAYTRLSERFEPRRRSHSGNVFTKVFFAHGRFLLPLKVLREHHKVAIERELFQQSGGKPSQPDLGIP